MPRNRLAALAAAVAAVVVTILVVSLAGPRGAATPSPSASEGAPTPSLSPSTSASATPTASTANASPSSAVVRYASPLGYSLELPAPWHKSSCSVLTQQSPDPTGEIFVPIAARDDVSTDVGPLIGTMAVFAEANPQNITPRQWAEQGKTIGGTAGERVEDVTYAGRPAARKTIPGTSLASYFVADRARMFVVNPNPRLPMSVAMEQAMGGIVASFAFLSDAERTAARAALPTAGPPRTPEQVADGLLAAFSAKNVDALAALSAPCMSTAGENAGATTVSREKYLDDLRTAFAGGLVVTVRARPIDGDRASGNVTIGSAWQAASLRERKLMIRRGENDRWEWMGTIERFS